VQGSAPVVDPVFGDTTHQRVDLAAQHLVTTRAEPDLEQRQAIRAFIEQPILVQQCPYPVAQGAGGRDQFRPPAPRDVAHHGQQQELHRAELMLQGTPCDPGPFRDGGSGGPGIAALVEQGDCSLDQAPLCALPA
jgi:hypothetical protein